jgi:two-component system phosphate regulon response regulator PhoB
VRALIRRSQGLTQQQLLVLGTITLDPDNKSVDINREKVKISGMEYRLLHFFMKNPGRLYSRAQLLDSVWGQTVFVEERTVDVHIMRLRKILKKYKIDSLLKTIRGAGYRFSVNND